jgi:hypothetical protein
LLWLGDGERPETSMPIIYSNADAFSQAKRICVCELRIFFELRCIHFDGFGDFMFAFSVSDFTAFLRKLLGSD